MMSRCGGWQWPATRRAVRPPTVFWRCSHRVAGSASRRLRKEPIGMSTTEAALEPGKARLLHTMLRVKDLDKSLHFYSDLLGMKVLRKRDYPSGKFTLAFVGYGEETDSTV